MTLTYPLRPAHPDSYRDHPQGGIPSTSMQLQFCNVAFLIAAYYRVPGATLRADIFRPFRAGGMLIARVEGRCPILCDCALSGRALSKRSVLKDLMIDAHRPGISAFQDFYHYNQTICLSQQCNITLVVFPLAVFEGGINDEHIHAFGLWYIVQAAIPAAAIEACGGEDELAPTIEYLHAECRKPRCKQLAREEVIVQPITVWRKDIGDVHVTIVADFDRIRRCTSVHCSHGIVSTRLHNIYLLSCLTGTP